MVEGSQWLKQYELLINGMWKENDRFWTRFQVSLFINGGLIVAVSALLGISFNQTFDTNLAKSSIVVLGIMGIIFSVIWISIIRTSRGWQFFLGKKNSGNRRKSQRTT